MTPNSWKARARPPATPRARARAHAQAAAADAFEYGEESALEVFLRQSSEDEEDDHREQKPFWPAIADTDQEGSHENTARRPRKAVHHFFFARMQRAAPRHATLRRAHRTALMHRTDAPH